MTEKRSEGRQAQIIYVFERLQNKKWVLARRSPRLNRKRAEKEARELTGQYTYALYRVSAFVRFEERTNG